MIIFFSTNQTLRYSRSQSDRYLAGKSTVYPHIFENLEKCMEVRNILNSPYAFSYYLIMLELE